MQDFNPDQLEDRRKRIKFVQRLCENNNFPFFADLLDGSSNQFEGPWVPAELTKTLRGNINSPELFFEHWFINCNNNNPVKYVFQNAIKQIKAKIQMHQSCLKATNDERHFRYYAVQKVPGDWTIFAQTFMSNAICTYNF